MSAEVPPQRGPLPLAGVRVLDAAQGVSGPFATRWLAALGADVLKLEPPGGDEARRRRVGPDAPCDPERGPFFLYLGAGKRSAVLDLETAAGRETLARLCDDADLLIHSFPPADWQRLGLDGAIPSRDNPSLVAVAVTPFGSSGPFRDLPAPNLVLAALAGMPWHLGDPGQPPLVQGGPQAEYLAGLHALGAALAGWLGAVRHGAGARFDLSQLECAASLVGHFTARVGQTGSEWPSRRRPRALWRLYRCADGWAGICALARNYERLADVTGIEAIRTASPFLDPERAREEEERLTALLGEWFAGRKRAEIRDLALRERVPLAVVHSIADLVESPQLRARGFFDEREQPGAGPRVLPGQLWRSEEQAFVRADAPRLGEHQADLAPDAPPWRGARVARPAPPSPGAPPAPLQGIRVLDLGQIWAGPYAAMLLADQGAEVVKVESPRACDPNRLAAAPPHDHGEHWWNVGAYFCEYNHGKRCLGLDYATPRGREILGRLVERCDVVVENFRADVLDKLGIGYAWLRERRPDVILLSMAAFGKTGPERGLPGYGPLIEQTSGLAATSGLGESPAVAGYAFGDPVASLAGASAVLAALAERERSGLGQHLDLAQREVAACLVGEVFAEWSTTRRQPPRWGNGHPEMAPHGLYPCRGRPGEAWVAIAVRDDRDWRALRTAMGDPAWARASGLDAAAGRRAARAEVDAGVSAWTRRLDREEVFARCRARGVPAGPLRRMRELPRDPQLRSRGLYQTVLHPEAPPWRAHGAVWRRSDAPPAAFRRAPDFGGHNREILGELLGLGTAEIDALERDGVVASVPGGVPPRD